MSLVNYVYLAAVLFCLGGAAVLTRRNAIVVFMGVELMLNAVNITFVTFARMHGTLDGQVDRCRGFRFDPVAEAAERPVRLQRRADSGDQVIECAGPAGARLDDDLQLGPVLVMVAQGRKRHLRLARIAVSQDDQPGRRDPLGQHLVAQGQGGKRLQPRMQRGEDGLAGRGHTSSHVSAPC